MYFSDFKPSIQCLVRDSVVTLWEMRRLQWSVLPPSGYNASNRLVRTAELVNPYPTAFPYGNGMVLHFYQQQESSTTKRVHKVINKGLKAYV